MMKRALILESHKTPRSSFSALAGPLWSDLQSGSGLPLLHSLREDLTSRCSAQDSMSVRHLNRRAGEVVVKADLTTNTWVECWSPRVGAQRWQKLKLGLECYIPSLSSSASWNRLVYLMVPCSWQYIHTSPSPCFHTGRTDSRDMLHYSSTR